MLFEEAPQLRLTDELADQLVGLWGDRFRSRALPVRLSRRRSGSTYQKRDEGGDRAGPGDHGDDAAEEHVGDQHDRAGHRQGEEGEAGDREAVGEADQLALLLQAEGHPVVGGGSDQQDRRDRGAEQGEEVDVLLEGVDFGEVLLEGDGEQEGEEDLDAGQGDAQLLQQLAEVAIEAFALALVPSRRAFLHPCTIGDVSTAIVLFNRDLRVRDNPAWRRRRRPSGRCRSSSSTRRCSSRASPPPTGSPSCSSRCATSASRCARAGGRLYRPPRRSGRRDAGAWRASAAPTRAPRQRRLERLRAAPRAAPAPGLRGGADRLPRPSRHDDRGAGRR